VLITKKWLVEKGACRGGREWFTKKFPKGGEYQDILNALAVENNVSWAQWLLQHAGPDNTVYEAEDVELECSLFFAGCIKVAGRIAAKFILAGRDINAGDGIKAGRSIEADGSIEAGRSIEAGWGIEAGDGIKAGWGIKAGCDIEAGWGIEAGRSIEADGSIEAGRSIEAGWGIEAGDGIKAGCDIEAGRSIEAGWGIEAGDGIKAGWGIKAGDGINAGADWGIYAGLRLKLSLKAQHAKVIAKTRPKNLLLGEYEACEAVNG
jgi:UDP-3-O-[3-hydroxymyristoyl] glucosamine N-acyltransferase